jgi:hypothetical protein
MLERICISRHRRFSPDSPLDLGALGEAMLFYGEVRLVADAGVLGQLIRELSPSALIAMLSEGFLHITYLDGGYGIYTENTGTPFERHKPISYRSPAVSFDTIADREFEAKLGSSSKARKLRRSITPLVDFQEWDETVVDSVLADFRSNDYVSDAARIIAQSLAPHLHDLDGLRFEIHEEGETFAVSTNIDYQAVNQEFHALVPPGMASVTTAFMLTELVESQVQIQRGAEYDAEIVADPITSRLIRMKCSDLLAGGNASRDMINAFEERLLEGRAVREAINSGTRTFSDLLEVIAASRLSAAGLMEQPTTEISSTRTTRRSIATLGSIHSLRGRAGRWTDPLAR